MRPVCWAELDDVRGWLRDARAVFADLVAAAREGSRRRKHRLVSRAELRRQTLDAERAFEKLFAAAEAGLPDESVEKESPA